jgi:hypothetical protein
MIGERPVAFHQSSAFVIRSYGSSQTQNLENATTDAQSVASLARAAVEQVSAMRQQRRFAHGMFFLRLL